MSIFLMSLVRAFGNQLAISARRVFRSLWIPVMLASFVGALTGCGEDKPKSSIGDSATKTEVSAPEPSLSPEAQGKRLLHLIKVRSNFCPQIIDMIAQDKNLEESLKKITADKEVGADNPELIKLIQESSVATSEPIQFLLKNQHGVRLGIYCHPGPMLVFSQQTQNCMYCTPTTFKELQELEKLGPTEWSWRIRELWMNAYLQNLSFPTDMLQAGITFDSFASLFEDSKRIYRVEPLRTKLQVWLNNAEKQINGRAAAAEKQPDFPTTDEQKAQNRATINQFLQKLRAGL